MVGEKYDDFSRKKCEYKGEIDGNFNCIWREKIIFEKRVCVMEAAKKKQFFLSGQSTKRGRVVRGCKLRKKLLF